MVTRSLFTELYAPDLRNVVFENFSYGETEYDKIFNVVGVNKRRDLTDYDMAGFGSVPVKNEGTGIVYDDPIPGSSVTYSWTPYGKGFRITHEAMEDELYGQMRKMAGALGRAFRNQTEINAIALLDDAFAGATFTGFDSLALCHTAHTNLRGGTQRNEPSTAVDISVSSLQDAMVDFEKFTDHSGVPIVVQPKTLVIAPESIPLVKEIFGSPQKPFTADNENNILQGWLNVVVSHYLSDSDAFFILADKSAHDLQFFWREKFTTDSADDFDTGDGKMKGYMRSGVGFGQWQGVWGSPGV